MAGRPRRLVAGVAILLLFFMDRTPGGPQDALVPTRLAVYRIICAEPGISLRRLARRLEVRVGTITHHVAVLEREGLVETHVAGRRRMVYPRGAPVMEDPAARALLEEETSRRIALAIVAHRKIGVMELMEEAQCSQRVAYYHVKRLIEAGLVTTEGRAGYHGLCATSELYQLLGGGPGSQEAPHG